MRMTGRCVHAESSASGAGFSLLEVVIAAALLLLTVSAVTACVASVSRAGRRAEAARGADRALGSVAEWLGALPYCAAELPSRSVGRGRDAIDLVAAVFPNACSSMAAPDARFVSVDDDMAEAGSFVTRLSEGGVPVVCVARYRQADGTPLEVADLQGFDVAVSEVAPAPRLEVVLSARAGGITRRCGLMRLAGAAVTLEGPETPE
jgi:hypothetical protein